MQFPCLSLNSFVFMPWVFCFEFGCIS
jgi:hypothetical protein